MEKNMSWIYLTIAGLLEVVWAWSMKQSDGFTRPVPTTITLVAMIASFWLLSLAMRTLPLGTAYTVWTGIGAVGAFAVGVAVLGEPLTALRIVAVILIVSGLVLMKLSASH
jgi:quaternary ammonium compound-resistance protein SugE